jgi:hypothetical protein
MSIGSPRAMYEELKTHVSGLSRGFQWEYYLERGLDYYFIGRYADIYGNRGVLRVSDVWYSPTLAPPWDSFLKVQKHIRLVAIYSRYQYRYPHVHFNVKLPSLSLPGNASLVYFYFGLENGSEMFSGIASFRLETTTTYSNRLRVEIGLKPPLALNIDVAKPADFDTAYHNYSILCAKNLVLFIVDGRLRAVAIQASPDISYIAVYDSVLPYSIAIIPPLPERLSFLLEYIDDRSVELDSDLELPFRIYGVRISEGKEIIPLSLSLYELFSDTVLRGYSISSGYVISHPVPTWGYEKKTIYFMADQAGTLDIQTYHWSRSWRIYDSISVPANTLVKYRIEDPALLARVVFTPSTYPATILEAEAQMQ